MEPASVNPTGQPFNGETSPDTPLSPQASHKSPNQNATAPANPGNQEMIVDSQLRLPPPSNLSDPTPSIRDGDTQHASSDGAPLPVSDQVPAQTSVLPNPTPPTTLVTVPSSAPGHRDSSATPDPGLSSSFLTISYSL